LAAFVRGGKIAVGIERHAHVGTVQAVGIGAKALRITDGSARRADGESLAGVVEEKRDAVGAGAGVVVSAPEIRAERDRDGVAGGGDGGIEIDGVREIERIVRQAQPAGAGGIDRACLGISTTSRGAGGEDGGGGRVAGGIQHPAGGGGILEIFGVAELGAGGRNEGTAGNQRAQKVGDGERQTAWAARESHLFDRNHIPLLGP